MSEELRPYVREYGGGDDRWCWCRQQFTKEVWDLLCDGHGRDFEFAEYTEEVGAWRALAKACASVGRTPQGLPLSKARSAKTYRPKPIPPVYVSAFSARPDTRTIQQVLRVPRGEQTKRDVLRMRNEAAVFGGCCDRFADNMGCNCLEDARDG